MSPCVCRFTVRVSDAPGGVSKLCNLLANLGVSIKDIMHERAFIRDVNSVEVSTLLALSLDVRSKNEKWHTDFLQIIVSMQNEIFISRIIKYMV